MLCTPIILHPVPAIRRPLPPATLPPAGLGLATLLLREVVVVATLPRMAEGMGLGNRPNSNSNHNRCKELDMQVS